MREILSDDCKQMSARLLGQSWRSQYATVATLAAHNATAAASAAAAAATTAAAAAAATADLMQTARLRLPIASSIANYV